MDELNRALGRMEGKVEAIHSEVKHIGRKVEDLTAFKWKIIGMSTAISLAATVAFYLLTGAH